MEELSNQTSASTYTVREKVDIAWNHFAEVKGVDEKKQFKCLHCGVSYKGGGINRMKQHLAGVKGNIAACKKVPHDVRYQMQENLKEILRKKMAVARWFFYCCIPFNALTSVYAPKIIDVIVAIGPGYKLPSYHNMRVNLLRDCKEECRLLIDSYRKTWKDTGYTLMTDGWTDSRSRTLINFLIYCPRGVAFLKSVDASDITKDATTLCSLFAEVVEWVGPESVVQIVTDNAANYKKAGQLLHERFNNIYWSPYAAHCMNLILKDIGSMPLIEDLAKKASKLTFFCYNHIFILAWLKKRPGWKEIVRPGATRFPTTFITLKSVHEHHHDLQALITSKFFVDSKISKTSKGKEVVSIILDLKFWDNCLIISKILGPLIRMLRIVDSDEKPSLGYLYDVMYRARKTIKVMFRNVKRSYKPFTTIIKRRRDTQLRQGIHAASYFVNPHFQYDRENYCQKPGILQGLVELIGNKDICSKPTLVMNEVRLFRYDLESFGKPIALTMAKEMQPDEWWKMFGSSAPNLLKVAIKILSQTSSSSVCERNWSVFEQIYSKRRNYLEHQRLNDLVYVRYNLNLKNRYDLTLNLYTSVNLSIMYNFNIKLFIHFLGFNLKKEIMIL
ncbi:hypothetical protein MA16_Dca016878 [Dendrobium catenatum]|uniref:BED-type domain-containing protein n=1 Tax=Dendrobium catenatum TaxID=906689 RepID=A0A2I0WNV1_9ASPA|nr:hypothetical protein MA16_Dca016878 [Dendrobium catenatum]